MTKTYLYIPDELDKRIIAIVRQEKRSKAEVMRQILEQGLAQGEKNAGAEVLLKLAELGKKYRVRGPKDSSARMDELLWDRDWSKDG